MDEHERAKMRALYELNLLLFEIQREELNALGEAVAALKRSHDIITKMLKLTAEGAGFS